MFEGAWAAVMLLHLSGDTRRHSQLDGPRSIMYDRYYMQKKQTQRNLKGQSVFDERQRAAETRLLFKLLMSRPCAVNALASGRNSVFTVFTWVSHLWSAFFCICAYGQKTGYTHVLVSWISLKAERAIFAKPSAFNNIKPWRTDFRFASSHVPALIRCSDQ